VTDVRPFGLRIAVIDPPSERVQQSGLIVISEELQVETGLVVVNPMFEGAQVEREEVEGLVRLDRLPGLFFSEENKMGPGSLVYYQHGAGVKIKDVLIIPLDSIIAWEA
jgi:hypothetical protein